MRLSFSKSQRIVKSTSDRTFSLFVSMQLEEKEMEKVDI